MKKLILYLCKLLHCIVVFNGFTEKMFTKDYIILFGTQYGMATIMRCVHGLISKMVAKYMGINNLIYKRNNR